MTNIPAELIFTTPQAPAEPVAGEEVHFELDGASYTAIRPTKSVFVQLASSAARRMRDADRAAAVIDFLDEALSPESSAAIADRLRDRNDPLEYDTLSKVMISLIEYWSDRAAPANGPVVKTRTRKAVSG